MTNSRFARNQLLKHGWKEGSGLGKSESGIREAIKVKIKKDNTGVGHDPGKEFTSHWWSQVFDKAANSITVETKQGSIQVVKTPEDKCKKIEEKKSGLYAGFVKAAILQASENELLTEVSCHDNDESDQSDEETEKVTSVTGDQLFAHCEGRTAHKGARHGLKQNAKLLRIQEQEKLLLDKLKSGNKRDKKKKQCIDGSIAEIVTESICVNNDKIEAPVLGLENLHDEEKPNIIVVKAKKAKKKKRRRDVEEMSCHSDMTLNSIKTEITEISSLEKKAKICDEIVMESQKLNSKKKKKKKKNK